VFFVGIVLEFGGFVVVVLELFEGVVDFFEGGFGLDGVEYGWYCVVFIFGDFY